MFAALAPMMPKSALTASQSTELTSLLPEGVADCLMWVVEWGSGRAPLLNN